MSEKFVNWIDIGKEAGMVMTDVWASPPEFMLHGKNTIEKFYQLSRKPLLEEIERLKKEIESESQK